MIGLAVSPTDLEAAEEFFELFKTPWEVALPGKPYRVVLCSDARVENVNAELFLVYGLGETNVDREAGVPVVPVNGPIQIEWKGSTFPVYSGVATFDTDDRASTLRIGGRNVVDYRWQTGPSVVRRIG